MAVGGGGGREDGGMRGGMGEGGRRRGGEIKPVARGHEYTEVGNRMTTKKEGKREEEIGEEREEIIPREREREP